MKTKNELIRVLEQKFFDMLDERADELLVSIKKNEFSFISEGKVFSGLNGINMNCDKYAKAIDAQTRKFDVITDQLEQLEGYPLTDDGYDRVYQLSMKLLPSTIKLGYNEQAENILKILKNNKINGYYSELDVTGYVLQIAENYGKRQIFEGFNENQNAFEENADMLALDVYMELYGKDTKEKLSYEKIMEVYNNAYVVIGDTKIDTQGKREFVEKKDKVK